MLAHVATRWEPAPAATHRIEAGWNTRCSTAFGFVEHTTLGRQQPRRFVDERHCRRSVVYVRNIAVLAGAAGDEIECVVVRLKEGGHVRMDVAQKVLAEIRAAP